VRAIQKNGGNVEIIEVVLRRRLGQGINPFTGGPFITHTAVGTVNTTGNKGFRPWNTVDAGAPGP
jgi:hypothetical protein